MKEAQERLTIPVHYGAQPDLGRYSAPDGPVGNWSELLPQMKIDEARAAQEEAVELAVEDMVFVAESMWEAGADGINFDTAGAAGDADFLATLLGGRDGCAPVTRTWASWSAWPARSLLGTHGQLEYHGTRLAGLKPAGQLAVVRRRPARPSSARPSTTNTSKSSPGTAPARSPSSSPAWPWPQIPVHMNVGMGVGGMPMYAFAPRRRGHARFACVRRHPASRRLVGGLGRRVRHGRRPLMRLGHERLARHRRPGGETADDEGHEDRRGQAVRGRSARGHAARPVRQRGDARAARRAAPGPASSRPRSTLLTPTRARSRPSGTSPSCSSCRSTRWSCSRPGWRRRAPGDDPQTDEGSCLRTLLQVLNDRGARACARAHARAPRDDRRARRQRCGAADPGRGGGARGRARGGAAAARARRARARGRAEDILAWRSPPRTGRCP